VQLAIPAVALATGKATLAGQVEGDGTDERGYTGPPGCGLGVRLTTSPRKKRIVTKPYNEYPTETKDENHGLDIWHMEHSDHAAAREDDGDSRLSLNDVSTDLRKMGINEWRDRARD
jgi:hypothetical protein